MSEPNIELSELCQGVLSAELLDTLIYDLTSLTEIESVIVKGGEFSMAERTQMDLRTAVEHLKAKNLRGVQIRYGWEGKAWLDTLLNSPEGVKLVRMPERTS